MNRFIQTILFVFLAASTAFSQERDSMAVDQDSMVYLEFDSIYNSMEYDSIRADSLAVVEDPEVKSPSKALMFSLVLPGLGQAYNHKYWKMPIVWGAMGVAGYAIVYNTRAYRGAISDYAQNPDDTNQRYLEFWRKNMELSYIAMLAVYALQVLDAYVDALLYSWDVNDDLSLRVSPSLQPLMAPTSLTGQSFGLTCSFNIRGR